MSAVDVIDTQADLSQAMLSRGYSQYIAVAVHPVMGLLWDLPEGADTDTIVRSEAARLRAAHSYHVNADMSALVHAAAVNLTADGEATPLAFHPEDLPTEQGFAMFDGMEPDAVLALSWGPVTERFTPEGRLASAKQPGVLKAGLRITSYTGPANHPRLLADLEKSWDTLPGRLADLDTEITRLTDQLGELQRQAPDDTDTLDRITGELAKARTMRTDLAGIGAWREKSQLRVEALVQWGRTVTPPKLTILTSICVPREATPTTEASTRQSPAALAWTLFYFCRQTIASVEDEAAHPRTAKRWRKLPIPKMTTVIRLRRSSTPRDGAPTAVEWSHRWLVRGHWRKQRVGPGRAEVRPVWVQGYVKGPDGVPLVVSNHVYDLVR